MLHNGIRADNVGSFLRPSYLTEARRSGAPEEVRRELEDRAIREVLAFQEEVGLPIVTDGEFRRRHYFSSVVSIADGFDPEGFERRHRDARGQEAEPIFAPTPVARLKRKASLVDVEFAYTRQHTSLPVKVTMPAPSLLACYWTEGVSDRAYESKQAFTEDLVTLLNEDARALAAAGVAYLQLDAPHYSFIDKLLPGLEDSGEALRQMAAQDIKVFDGVQGPITGMHICRGNERSRFTGTDPYEVFAGAVFPECRVDRLLLEYDDQRAGGFEALRFVPEATTAVLGLVTTKRSEMESEDQLEAQIDEAATHIPLDRLALSTQCGFASNADGNEISFDAQRSKLELVTRMARSVWGASPAETAVDARS